VEKIRTIREAIPSDKPLAIASGITPENVRDFLPYIDYVLVATGVSKNYHELDRDKLQRLVAACKETR
jgi:predicted TIM-barrel enzyme